MTYAACQMMCIRQEFVVYNCTLIVTISVQYGYLTRSDIEGAEYAADGIIYLSYASMVLLCAFYLVICPYVCMGIVAY